jgi:hypothetical protein
MGDRAMLPPLGPGVTACWPAGAWTLPGRRVQISHVRALLFTLDRDHAASTGPGTP